MLEVKRWAARFDTWLLINLVLKSVVFSFLFFGVKQPYDD